MNIKKGPLGFPAKRYAKKCENANCENIITKCENFVKTMSFTAATINCSKEHVEFSALHDSSIFEVYYVI